MKSKGFISILLLIILISLAVVGARIFLKKDTSPGNTQPQNSSSTSTAGSTPIASPENIKTITENLKLNYIFNPKDGQTRILKQVDFKTNSLKETKLPFDDSVKKYLLSLDQKHILKIGEKELQVADLSDPNLNFKTLHTVPVMITPEFPDVDFAYIGDAMWADDNKIFFTVSVGLDGRANPLGVYSDLYEVDIEGTNKKLINDHTIDDQNYSFMGAFAYFDSSKNEIYFSGNTHGGHLDRMAVVDAASGKLKLTLKDLYTDIHNPVFNKDFSKAYYLQDFAEKGYLTPVRIYEYDMNNHSKKVVYSINNPSSDYSAPGIEDENGFFYHPQSDSLFFSVTEDDKKLNFYQLKLSESSKPKVIFSTNDWCFLQGVSKNADYLMIECIENGVKNFSIHQVSTGKAFDFYKDTKSPSAYPYPDDTLNILSFE